MQGAFAIALGEPGIYYLALAHVSVRLNGPDGQRLSNERLEFLGDAVLELLMSEALYRRYPDMSEGDLTRLRSQLVSRQYINRWAEELGVGEAMARIHGVPPESRHILGNALEALFGAMFLDRGLEPARSALSFAILEARVDWQHLLDHMVDYKSQLLHWAQAGQHAVEFVMGTYRSRPPRFTCRLLVDGQEVLTSIQPSKKEAQKQAAKLFIQSLGEQGARLQDCGDCEGEDA
ncbi:MAG: ribonuclease III [Bacteroidia bacterium]|nr:MAG: ribonuclease III [Bacteroidia bacterium]